jgi:hypothetical protein
MKKWFLQQATQDTADEVLSIQSDHAMGEYSDKLIAAGI